MISIGSFFFFQAEDGIRDFCLSRGLGDVYKRQILRGLSGFPVMFAGHAAVHRPHSVHEYPSRRFFHERSFTSAAPKVSTPSASRSIGRMTPTCPGPLVLEKNVLGSDVMTWRCFEYGR